MSRYEYSTAERTMLEALPVPFAIYQFLDKRVCTLILSQGFLNLFGFDDKDEAYRIMDSDMYRDAHPDDVSKIASAAVDFATKDVPYDVVYRSKVPDATSYTVVHARGTHFLTDDGTRLAAVSYFDEGLYLDESDLSDGDEEPLVGTRMSEAIRVTNAICESHYDEMTGLPNMGYFFELAKAARRDAKRHGESIAIAFVNLAGMKDYNHRHGFSKGNRLITSVARVLATEFDNERCCYLGQDHFAVLAPEEGLHDRLERVVGLCEHANGGDTLPVKVGVCVDRFSGDDVVVACDRARIASNEDRGSYVSSITYFDETMLERSAGISYVLANFDRALADGWIVVYYQPIVRSEDGLVCDREALARWFDPSIGMVPPIGFIPILEEHKLIHRLDLAVIDQVIRDIQRDARDGRKVVPVSVNLSRADFDACDMVEEIRKRVDDAGILRKLINIEITESAASKDSDYMGEQIGRFHDLGFHIWMDDFGSGYSSIDALESLHFDLIKFDMRFTRQILESERSQVILSDMMRMVQNLHISTLVEGVENEEQSKFLAEHGCNKQQGFFYSPPRPHGDIADMEPSDPIEVVA